MSEPQRILLVRLSHLGDVVHALPVFHALRAAHPNARIAWATQSEFAPLLEGLPGLERVLCFARRGGAAAWLALRDELAAFAPDLAVDAQGNVKSAMAALASGAPRRVGLHRSDWREGFGALASSERAPAATREGAADPPHAVERMLALAEHLSNGAPLRARFDPGLRPSELERGRALYHEHTTPGEPPVVLLLATPGDVRSWPAARFAELARDLARRGRAVLVLSGPDEEALGRELARELASEPLVRHWVGQRGLRELAAFFAAAANAGSLLVSCDSGPMHLAAASGMRVVVLSGPQSHLRTGPWPIARLEPSVNVSLRPSPHAAIRAASQPPCAPCFERRCSHTLGPVCMEGIEPAQVIQTLCELFSLRA